jgi:hypothetical protein
VLNHLDELPSSGWLYIPQSIREVKVTTECYPREIDSREVSEEEISEFEAAVAAAGFKSFLTDDQLRDVIANLELQRAGYTREDLERAIDFYWRRDAFIVLPADGA